MTLAETLETISETKFRIWRQMESGQVVPDGENLLSALNAV